MAVFRSSRQGEGADRSHKAVSSRAERCTTGPFFDFASKTDRVSTKAFNIFLVYVRRKGVRQKTMWFVLCMYMCVCVLCV